MSIEDDMSVEDGMSVDRMSGMEPQPQRGDMSIVPLGTESL